jgi:hypothetical protein
MILEVVEVGPVACLEATSKIAYSEATHGTLLNA